MKKVLALVLILMMAFSTAALATTFTHPETGEEITIGDDGSLAVYGEEVYMEIQPGDTLHGIVVGQEIYLVETMTAVSDDLQAKIDAGEVQSMQIASLEKIVTPEMKQKIDKLSVKEQILVALVALGFGDQVQAAIGEGLVLSADAQSIIDEISESGLAVGEAQLAELFPLAQIEIDGVMYEYYAIELIITYPDGTAYTERYGFRKTEDGQWVLERLYISAVNSAN